jgi:hypothetical protein
MSIKQFKGSYLCQEDRILFCFNTSEKAEYKLWFTRRVTLFILAATAHLWARKFEQTHTPEAAKALTDFQREAVKEAQAPNQVYEGGMQYPIGASPLLVIEINCALTKEGEGDKAEDVLSIDFILPGGANLNLKMGGDTLQAMCLLLDQMRQQALWGELLSAAAIPDESEKPATAKFH